MCTLKANRAGQSQRMSPPIKKKGWILPSKPGKTLISDSINSSSECSWRIQVDQLERPTCIIHGGELQGSQTPGIQLLPSQNSCSIGRDLEMKTTLVPSGPSRSRPRSLSAFSMIPDSAQDGKFSPCHWPAFSPLNPPIRSRGSSYWPSVSRPRTSLLPKCQRLFPVLLTRLDAPSSKASKNKSKREVF
ncbi:hypothetical protein NL676_007037 [Syzygium grande]|nr:hypothetical protein NL676_007037 [Syzygium grande]